MINSEKYLRTLKNVLSTLLSFGELVINQIHNILGNKVN